MKLNDLGRYFKYHINKNDAPIKAYEKLYKTGKSFGRGIVKVRWMRYELKFALEEVMPNETH